MCGYKFATKRAAVHGNTLSLTVAYISAFSDD